MSYKIIWEEKASGFLKSLNKPDIQRILKKVSSIADDPVHYLEPLVGISSYKLRVGDYRLLMDMDKGKLLLTIVFIGHRKDIYQYVARTGLKAKS